ncbi:putative necrosis-inducing factor-domain-containing protein, partial [Podospora australis]
LGKAGDEIFRIGFDIVPGSYQVDENTWFSNRTWHLVDSPNTDIDRGNNDAAFAPRVDDCRDESTYENEWSNSSPLVADCWQIYNNIEGDGTWTVAINFHRELVNYGTCAFGVRSIRTNHITTVFYYVGNDDIRLTIDSAIEQMAKTDAAGSNRVGGEGRFECQPGTQLINWGIYH